jgi:hypothetical protein
MTPEQLGYAIAGFTALVGAFFVWKANSQTVTAGSTEWLVESLRLDAEESRQMLEKVTNGLADMGRRLGSAERVIARHEAALADWQHWVVSLRRQLVAEGVEPVDPPETLGVSGRDFW